MKGYDYLTKVITGIEFKDDLEVDEIDLIAAKFKGQNTTLGYNSELNVISLIEKSVEANKHYADKLNVKLIMCTSINET